MEKRVDQRIVATKRRLQEALLRMLRSMPLQEIAIRELCREAGVNRTTFYNHYGSQYDLFGDVSQRFIDSVAARLDSADPADRENVHQRVAMVLAYMEENRELTGLLLNNSIDPGFAERIFALPQIGGLLGAALVGCHDESMRTAIASFVIHGCYKLLQDWINREDRLPPAQQTELMLSLAQRVCQ